MTGMLITGGKVVDGTGAPGRIADVRVRNGRIVEVAPGLTAQGEQIIDATGAIVAPGFIDSHTHFDATLYWDPSCDPMPQHGVTSVVIGNCSLGFAPVKPADRESQIDLYSYIEDMPGDILSAAVPWDWVSFPEYAAHLGEQSLGVNVASFVGHSQLRIFVMGESAWERAATAEEIAGIVRQLEDALAAGALGLSFSLFDRDRKGRKVPSMLADDAEMDAVFATLAAHQATFQFVGSGEGSDQLIGELEWLAGFMERHKVTAFYNAVVELDSDPGRSRRVMDLLENLDARGVALLGMVSPRQFELSIGFEQTICLISVPAWNELVQTPAAEKQALLASPDWRERARNDADTCHSAMFPFDRPERLRIRSAGNDASKKWLGRSLGDLATERGGHVSDVLADWLIENDLDTSFIFAVANTDETAVAGLLQHKCNFVSGSDAGAHLQMFCAAGDATLLLTRFVQQRQDMTVENAVHALTGRQAELLGLRDRGVIEAGKSADITIFAIDELQYGPPYLVSDLPSGRSRLTREAGGYRYTIVNGAIVQENGELRRNLPGRWLERATVREAAE